MEKKISENECLDGMEFVHVYNFYIYTRTQTPSYRTSLFCILRELFHFHYRSGMPSCKRGTATR